MAAGWCTGRCTSVRPATTTSGTISKDSGGDHVEARARTEREPPLGFGSDAAASKGDEVRYYKTKNIHTHFLDDGDTLLTLVRRLHVPDWGGSSVATVAYACDEPSPDLRLCISMELLLK